VLNERIQGDNFRVVDDQSKQIGVLSRFEALKTASEAGVDLVLIAPHANPPVVKLIDYNKFIYQESKKQQEAKKGAKKSTTKDLKLSLFVGPGDRDRLMEKAKEFIEDGHQVRINLVLRGRELGKKPMAFEKMTQFIKDLGEVNVSTEPKMQGKLIVAVVSKKKLQ
jgi:translation initiation factor IF-3